MYWATLWTIFSKAHMVTLVVGTCILVEETNFRHNFRTNMVKYACVCS
jgi:hypothetical protein